MQRFLADWGDASYLAASEKPRFERASYLLYVSYTELGIDDEDVKVSMWTAGTINCINGNCIESRANIARLAEGYVSVLDL